MSTYMLDQAKKNLRRAFRNYKGLSQEEQIEFTNYGAALESGQLIDERIPSPAPIELIAAQVAEMRKNSISTFSYDDSAVNPLGVTTCIPNCPIKKENNMDNMYQYSEAYAQREVLREQLREARDAKRSDLKVKYGMNSVRPKTLQELTDALTKGYYEIDKTQYNADGGLYTGWQGVLSTIKWTDPSVKKDEAGFKAADVLLGDAYTSAKNKIIVLAPVDGLAALDAFKTQA